MDEELVKRIFCCYRYLKQKINQVLKRRKISFVQFHILYFVKNNQRIIHRRLAEKLNISLPTLSIFIDKMINKQLVRKKVPKEDKRKAIVLLTKKGENILEKSREEIRKLINALFKNFTESEKKTFVNLLKKTNLL